MIYKHLHIRLIVIPLAILLGACATAAPTAAPGAQPARSGLPTATPASGELESSSSNQQPQATLPPPLIVTIPADMLDIHINGEAAANGAITTQGASGGGLVQFDEGLPDEVEALLDKIYRGEYPIDTTGQQPGSLPATYTYSDMNGDGIEDLVIILVVEAGDYSNVTAGASHGIPVIQIIPKHEPGSVVEGFSIPVEELLAMGEAIDETTMDQGAYLITLAPEELSRWSQPFSPD